MIKLHKHSCSWACKRQKIERNIYKLRKILRSIGNRIQMSWDACVRDLDFIIIWFFAWILDNILSTSLKLDLAKVVEEIVILQIFIQQNSFWKSCYVPDRSCVSRNWFQENDLIFIDCPFNYQVFLISGFCQDISLRLNLISPI